MFEFVLIDVMDPIKQASYILKVLFNAYLADLIIFLGFGSVKLQINVFNNLTIFLPNSGVLVLESLFLPFYGDTNPGIIFNA